MNNDIEKKTYPCDEPEAKRSYPCDTDGEVFSYAEDSSSSSDRAGFAGNDAGAAPVRKGKGRRGGNASASVVVHSGNFKPRREDGDDRRGYGRTEHRDRDDERGYRSRGFNERRRDDDRGYGRSDRRERGYDEERNDRRFGRSDRDNRTDRGRFDDNRDDRRTFRDRRDSDSFGDRRDRRASDRFGDSGDRREFDRREQRGDRRDFDRREARGDRRDRRSYGDSDRRERRFGSDRFEDRRGSRDGGRFRGERGHNPEEVFSRSYGVEVLKTSDVGAFVAAPDAIINSVFGRKLSDSNSILLPFSEQLGRPVRGDIVKVHFYEDKGGRLAATMRTPILRDGEVGILTVAAVTSIGAFLDNGVPKQVLLPFKEQIAAPKVGDEVLVWIYSDKSGRQAATMRVYGHLDKHSPYKEDDRVTGFVYEINQKLGIFVAVDNKYYGLVPMAETFKEYEYGDEVEARVAKVREDGKLDLLIRDKLYKTVNEDADVILYELKRNNGFLPYGDRADAAFIEETYAMSKNQFKRALGHLYKNRIVELDRENDTVKLISD